MYKFRQLHSIKSRITNTVNVKHVVRNNYADYIVMRRELSDNEIFVST